MKTLRYLDDFYYRVQRDILKSLVCQGLSTLFVGKWDSTTVYVTPDRCVFYCIPWSKYFLKEPVSFLDFNGQRFEYLSDLYPSGVSVERTGVLRPLFNGSVAEFSRGRDLLYVRDDLLKVFPEGCLFKASGSAVFVYCHIGTLLGGIETVNFQKQS